jgi:DNA-binding response OmpR family regulator
MTLKIFIVDGDPIAMTYAKLPLQAEGIEIKEFRSGDACLAAMDEAPDIIILDIEMPGTNGIMTCQTLRATGYAGVEVIFTSAHDDLTTRLAAHDVSGNDFIAKPYALTELVEKVEVAKRAIRARREVAEHVKRSRQVTASNVYPIGEMQAIVAFMRTATTCETIDELGVLLADTLKAYDLHGLVDLRDGQGKHFCYSSEGRLTALEASILDHMRGVEHTYRFHDRLVIQYPHVTLLLPNLPLEDYERASDLNDHLTVLVSSTNTFIALLLCKQAKNG